MNQSPRKTFAALTMLAGAALASAADDVDLQVRGNERVDGTLRPADERESFLVDAPSFARITATAKRTSDGAPLPTLELIDGASVVLAAGTATSKGSKLSLPAVPVGGVLRLRVAGDGVADGDYRLTLKMSPRTAWSFPPSVALAPGEEMLFGFSAPAGSTADVSLTPARKSAFVPRILDIEGAGATLVPVDGSGATPRRHAVKGVALGPTGDYSVRFRNDGAAAGTCSISVRLSVPRITRANVDIRDGSLTGSFDRDTQVFGRVVDDGGGIVDPAAVGGALSGSSVSVPATAIGAPTVIALQASDTFFVDDKNHAAGVAVSLTPAGTVFKTPVTVTLPYDPQSFDDPASEISIFIQDAATGALEAVPKSALVIDTAANTVSFPTSHFSSFQGTSPKARPLKGVFVQLEIAARRTAAFGGDVSIGLHRVVGLNGARNGNLFGRDFDRRRISFGSGAISVVASPAPENGLVTVTDDENVTLTSPTEGALAFVRGRNDAVLIAAPSSGAPADVASLLLRVAKGAPTRANVAGAWHAFVFEFAARVDQGHALIEVTGQRLRLEFGIDGSVLAGPTVTELSNAGSPGVWAHRRLTKSPHPGTFQPGQGVVHLDMGLGVSSLSRTVDLVPVVRGDVLVGVTGGVTLLGQTPVAAMARTVILVRVSDGVKSALLGRALFAGFGLVPQDRAGAEQDFTLFGDDRVETRDGVSTLHSVGTRYTFDHDANGAPQFGSTDLDTTGAYSVGADGTYRESASSVFGAVAPRAGFYVTTRFGPQFLGVGFGVVGRSGP